MEWLVLLLVLGNVAPSSTRMVPVASDGQLDPAGSSDRARGWTSSDRSDARRMIMRIKSRATPATDFAASVRVGDFILRRGLHPLAGARRVSAIARNGLVERDAGNAHTAVGLPAVGIWLAGPSPCGETGRDRPDLDNQVGPSRLQRLCPIKGLAARRSAGRLGRPRAR
jgi:hypothetical protein